MAYEVLSVRRVRVIPPMEWSRSAGSFLPHFPERVPETLVTLKAQDLSHLQEKTEALRGKIGTRFFQLLELLRHRRLVNGLLFQEIFELKSFLLQGTLEVNELATAVDKQVIQVGYFFTA